MPGLSLPVAAAVNLNAPGTYLHWYAFRISEANLVVTRVMLVIFFAALLAPFPAGKQLPPEEGEVVPRPPAGAPENTSRSWTGGLRRLLVRWLPPERLLPETQPSYVASWAYVFGIASLAADGDRGVAGLHCRALHRLLLSAELRLPVDRHQRTPLKWGARQKSGGFRSSLVRAIF